MSAIMEKEPVRKVIGHWLLCERCRNPAVDLDEATGELRIGGIVLTDQSAEFHRDNTSWWEIRDIGSACGIRRKGIPMINHEWKIGQTILPPVKHETFIKRVSANWAFIDESIPIAIGIGQNIIPAGSRVMVSVDKPVDGPIVLLKPESGSRQATVTILGTGRKGKNGKIESDLVVGDTVLVPASGGTLLLIGKDQMEIIDELDIMAVLNEAVA